MGLSEERWQYLKALQPCHGRWFHIAVSADGGKSHGTYNVGRNAAKRLKKEQRKARGH